MCAGNTLYDVVFVVAAERATKVAAQQQEKLDNTMRKLLLARAKNAVLEQKMEHVAAVLHMYAECWHCDADSSCLFDDAKQCLRCLKRRTRHFA
jgi:tRNA A37 N6-isopentenylltransferase MiaA